MKMRMSLSVLAAFSSFTLAFLLTIPEDIGAQRAPAADPKQCFGCHTEVEQLWQGSHHVELGCGTCHGEMVAHLRDPETRPVTDLELSTCGSCHPDQYESFYRVNWHSPARLEKGIPYGRSPSQEKLLAPHGFTIEHNEPRGHAFMVTDMMVVDRFASGRYQFKEPWSVSRPGRVWDVVEDTGKTLPGMVSAGNPVCLQCKTTDLVLKWKYLGDQDPRAKWDRTSDLNALLRDVQNPMGCIHCHDPHATRSRVVRDALIEAVGRDGANPYAVEKENPLEIVSFRDFRKIGLLQDTRSNLICGQCHVEYSCNPGLPPQGEGRIPMEDRRANQFPWRNVLDLLEYYDQIGFRDFQHAVTGARLVKLQHPELETFWNSPHERAGVQCVDCHMAREQNKQGETFTSHMVLGPRDRVDEVCLRCHTESSPEEALYQIDAVQNYTRGQLRKAEYHLEVLIDTYALAARQGAPEQALADARRQHEIAHVLWEWWTAENSDGWHNPALARESLNASQEAAKKGVAILQEAMRQEVKAPVLK
jgi:nitrite reductase (cytochrome c-552)